MDRRRFLRSSMRGALGIVGTAALGRQAQAAPAKQPNILIMLADDMGYADLACYGGTARTPNLDRLAQQGVRFTDCYSAAPNCSPARAGLLTGRIPSRTGIYSYIPANHPMHLPRKEITVAKLLKKAGYDTCHVGKWHLGILNSPDQPQPQDHGFDYSLGTNNNATPSHKDPNNFIRNGKPLGKVEGYSCQIVADEAIDWLEARKDKENPFFMYVCFHEPHQKIASPPDLIAEYESDGKRDSIYFANIANIDKAAGKLMAALDRLDLTRDTFVLFTSDNGPWRNGSQGTLRGKKSEIYDGGIREPGILRWPGKAKPGAVSDEPIGFVDLLPTLCEMAGASVPTDRPIDGTSILPALEGKPLRRKTPLFWYFYRTRPQAAMRQGDWMIVGEVDDPKGRKTHGLSADDMPFIKSANLSRFELYNLRTDRSQNKDLAAAEPERLETMKRVFVKLHENVVAEGPVWKNLPAGPPARTTKPKNARTNRNTRKRENR